MNRFLAAVLLLAAAPAAAQWETFVITTRAEWDAAVAKYPEIPAPDQPRADFAKDMLVLVVGDIRPAAGYKVELTLLADPIDPKRLTVFYREISPKPPILRAAVMTRIYSYHRLPHGSYDTVTFEPNRGVSAPPRAEKPAVGEDNGRRVRALLPENPSFDGR